MTEKQNIKSKHSITFFLINFKRGGTEWVITNLANEFHRQGFCVNILSIKKGTMATELSEGINFHHFNSNYSKAFRGLYNHLRNVRPNVLFSSQHGASALTYIIGKLAFFKRMRIVREPDSNFEYYHKQRKKTLAIILKAVLKKSYRSADAVIVHTSATKDSLLKSKIIKDNTKNIFEIPNPIDIEKIQKKALDKTITNSTDLPKGGFIIYIGRLINHKNVDQIINSLPLLPDNISFVIIGTGPEEEKLKSLTRELKLDYRVFFIGALENPYPILKEAKTLVTIGDWEGFGMTVIESLALKVQVVGLNNGHGPSQILNHGEYGFLADNKTNRNISEAMLKSLTKPVNKNLLLQRAKEFESERIVKKYRSLFNLKNSSI